MVLKSQRIKVATALLVAAFLSLASLPTQLYADSCRLEMGMDPCINCCNACC